MKKNETTQIKDRTPHKKKGNKDKQVIERHTEKGAIIAVSVSIAFMAVAVGAILFFPPQIDKEMASVETGNRIAQFETGKSLSNAPVQKSMPKTSAIGQMAKRDRHKSFSSSHFGIAGTGRGGGGSGEKTIGLGNLNTLGHGGGGGTGSGYGRGAGGLGGRMSIRGPQGPQISGGSVARHRLHNPRFSKALIHNTESYDHIKDNPFLQVSTSPLSTFSIDVDTASYANVRRFINQSTLPPKDAVRIEELVNYFSYDYPTPVGNDPFSVDIEIAKCPWNKANKLARIGIKGVEFSKEKRPPVNLVFLIDVSGSMQPVNKLPLLKQAMNLLVNSLEEKDKVAMVVYAGTSGLVLESTSGSAKLKIRQSLEMLNAGGSTNGGEGIELAYKVATGSFIKNGINRVILATDGDLNVGLTDTGSLVRLIKKKAKTGVYLTVLGFGMGNFKDATLEKLADNGNGHFAYIDTINEAQKVLVEEIGSTLFTIAKDVKLQVEFNPQKVGAYRLIGYENRLLRARDFNDDQKDAGEIGAGHTVTALYELQPPTEQKTYEVDPLKYQYLTQSVPKGSEDELLTLKLRYKSPKENKSRLKTYSASDQDVINGLPSSNFRLAAAAASFGMILRDSPHKGSATLDSVITLARHTLTEDTYGYRKEFVALIEKAKQLKKDNSLASNTYVSTQCR